MVSPEHSQFHTSPMAKSLVRGKAASVFSEGVLFVGGALVAFLLVWGIWSMASPASTPSPNFERVVSDPLSTSVSDEIDSSDCAVDGQGVNLRHDPPDPTFYDNPKTSYKIGTPVKNWDEKRREWLKLHPSFAAGAGERILMLTGSQPTPCKNPIGDHFLLRFFKNKVDYCRIHGYDIFYNNVLLQPKMFTFWAKWTGLNAGVFLIRNCQWSLDFMEVWASMGPQAPDYDKWGKTLTSTFKDKMFPESDDQSGLVYLLVKEKDKWAEKIYLESQYYFEGYWEEIVGTLDNITSKYLEIEKGVNTLRRRHAEKVSESYAEQREPYLKKAGNGRYSWRRPFITHFTGCQPCSGKHNQMYAGESCWNSMQKALNFADNQVLRNFGFVHPDLLDSSTVTPLPFDYPA
eukprot:XP_019073907.1 PREDICTED: LOW QUALITY PROTEIN: galactomannan galactosyltransferase 1-like [Vitis vinifera]